jgi:hypothetical protein
LSFASLLGTMACGLEWHAAHATPPWPEAFRYNAESVSTWAMVEMVPGLTDVRVGVFEATWQDPQVGSSAQGTRPPAIVEATLAMFPWQDAQLPSVAEWAVLREHFDATPGWQS